MNLKQIKIRIWCKLVMSLIENLTYLITLIHTRE